MASVQKLSDECVLINVFDADEGPRPSPEFLKAIHMNWAGGSSVVKETVIAWGGDDIVTKAYPSLRTWVQHGFMRTLHVCFSEHIPLEITPDQIWLLIMQGVSAHEAKTKLLGKAFGLPEEKKTISVRRDNFVLGAGNGNNWAGVFPEFAHKLRKNIPATLGKLLSHKFSTTGPLDEIAAAITMMETMQKYFSYELRTMCGIPSVRLTGTRKDWAWMVMAVNEWKTYDKILKLNAWLDKISPILQNFVDAFDGKVNETFWKSVYKHNSFSGGADVTGWATTFFPYAPKSWMQQQYTRNPVSGIRTFPSGIASVPFVWDYLGKRIPCRFYSGFSQVTVSIPIDGSGYFLTPAIAWAVAKDNNNPDAKRKRSLEEHCGGHEGKKRKRK